MASCLPGASPVIQDVFGDCIYNARDLVGFCCGLASIACWMVAQMPQLYRNYRTQSADALSPWFLAEWLLGDTFNLLGALLKGDQLPTVVFTAQYFICVDAVMLLQYLYLTSLQRRRERLVEAAAEAAARRRHRAHRHRHRHHHHHHHQHDEDGGGVGDGGGIGGTELQQQHGGSGGGAEIIAISSSGGGGGGGASQSSGAGGGVQAAAGGSRGDIVLRPQRALACLGALLLVAQLQPGQQLLEDGSGGISDGSGGGRRLLFGSGGGGFGIGGLGVHLPGWTYTAGTVLAYCSSVLYLTGRVSQIVKNHQRQSAEGLALSMFLCAIAANSCYGASILVRSYTRAELVSSLPWLVGSLGTVALDLTIFIQARMLGRAAGQKHHPSDEDEPLLPA